MKHEVPKGGSVGVGGWGEGKRAETNFSGIWRATSRSVTTQHGIVEFCAYFAEWSGARKQNSRIVVDQYAPLPKNSRARTLPIPCVPMGIVFALKVLTGEISNFIGTG